MSEENKDWLDVPENLANRELNPEGCTKMIGELFTRIGTVKPKINGGFTKEQCKNSCLDNIDYLLSKECTELLQSYCDVVEQDFDKIKNGLLRINREWLESY